MEGTQKSTPKSGSRKITETEIPHTCQNHIKHSLKRTLLIETIAIEPTKRKKAVRKQREHKQEKKTKKRIHHENSNIFLIYLKQRKNLSHD